MFLKCATVLAAAAAGALVAIPAGAARTPHPTAHAATVPAAVSDNLRELNNKLARTITRLKAELRKKQSVVKDTERERRALNDLEATKLRAVDGFPEVFGLPYAETFRNLIDGTPVASDPRPATFADGVAQMAVLDAVRRSAASREWVDVA